MELTIRQSALIAAATTALAAAAVVGSGLEWTVAPADPAAVAQGSVQQSAGDLVVPDHMALSVTDHVAL
ncbi:hypothetical protein ACIQF6_11055 [Kitasatospora sp. NPDC092948]|uniref:hypothetical protein n=1 Tax=Kitasatospora sp. NPDC092948 TaxID=3364088 RepID=UPI00382E1072